MYRQALIEEHQTQSLPKPSSRALDTFRKYFTTKKDGPILVGYDGKMLQDPEDLVALCPPADDDRLNRLLRYWFGYCLRVSFSLHLLYFIQIPNLLAGGSLRMPSTHVQNSTI